jgi:hypothetical protein
MRRGGSHSNSGARPAPTPSHTFLGMRMCAPQAPLPPLPSPAPLRSAPQVVRQLLQAGANTGAQNANGKRPAEVAALNPNNPVAADAELLAALQA